MRPQCPPRVHIHWRTTCNLETNSESTQTLQRAWILPPNAGGVNLCPLSHSAALLLHYIRSFRKYQETRLSANRQGKCTSGSLYFLSAICVSTRWRVKPKQTFAVTSLTITAQPQKPLYTPTSSTHLFAKQHDKSTRLPVYHQEFSFGRAHGRTK